MSLKLHIVTRFERSFLFFNSFLSCRQFKIFKTLRGPFKNTLYTDSHSWMLNLSRKVSLTGGNFESTDYLQNRGVVNHVKSKSTIVDIYLGQFMFALWPKLSYKRLSLLGGS